MTRPASRRDRGLAIGIIGFFAMLILAAMLYIMFDPALAALTDTLAADANNSQAQTVIRQRYRYWTYTLMSIPLIAGMMIIARAVFESGGGGL